MRVGIRAVLAVACLYYNATALLAQSSNEDIPAEPPAQIKTPYAVDGIAIGTRISSDRTSFREYRCSPSDQFDGFTWCQKIRNDRDHRGSYRATDSILYSSTGDISYVEHYQEPAFVDAKEVDEYIQRHSREIGESPQITQMAARPDHRDGIIALWGMITLEQVDLDSITMLQTGKMLPKELLVDFIGNVSRSAKEGLPIYRIHGGAGLIWIFSFDQSGRGTLRFVAVEASELTFPLLGPSPLMARPAPKPVQSSVAAHQATEAEDTVSAQSSARAVEDTRWLATAPGEVEPGSGEIRIGSSVAGRIAEVLIKAKDRVFAGELLVRLEDDDLRARVKVAEAQAALQKRVRNDVVASARAADRRKIEDAVADAEKAVVDARSAVDRSSAATRKNSAPESALAAARMELSRAQDRLNQQQGELRKLDAQSNVPLPTQPEGQLNIARAELAYANAVLEKLMIRAPIAGTVLQVNAKAGELASPASVLPLVSIGDVPALRVRAEVAELNIGAIKLGQPVLVRAASFREREFAGKVSSIAPSVEPRRIGEDGQRPPSDSKFVQVFVDLIDPGPFVVGMSVDVYFRPDAKQ